MSAALTGMVFNARRGRLKRTGQITCYARGDDGATQNGLLHQYDPLTLGQYALTSDIEVASYAAPTISFVAPNQVNDAGGGLAHILTGDTVVIKGSALNDGAYTVAGGGVAAGFTTVENTIVNEAAGLYVTLYKSAAHSNNCVRDLRTGLMWSRNTSNGEKVGVASTGLLNWYDVATVFPLHPAAADLAMVVPGNILRIVGGAAELPRYHAGDLLQPGGFASADNNLPCLYVVSATVSGADLDILTDPGNPPLVNEAAGGARTIGLVTRSIYNYAAGANHAGLANYTDWREANSFELAYIMTEEAPSGVPDVVAFPGWPGATNVWGSNTRPNSITTGQNVLYSSGVMGTVLKTVVAIAALIRG